jgi:site-specific DNA-methyltransferase (adenine-specific)
MWEQVKRVIKPRGAVVFFAAQPFTSALVMSNAKWFKYAWVWDKKLAAGFQIAKVRPMMRHEDICVFGNGAINYYPEMTPRQKPRRVGGYGAGTSATSPLAHPDGQVRISTHSFPTSFIEVSNANRAESLHPTQKPVELLRYLVRTYTNPGEVVLDFTMGSGTTGVACAMEGRHFIGVELDAGYFDIARKRIESVQPALMEAAD